MIKEYFYPEGKADRFGNVTGSLVTVNLRYVSSARPEYGGTCTEISVLDAGFMLIDEPYDRFIRDLRCVKCA